MKTLFKHLLTITLIAFFVALALGSAGSSPSSYYSPTPSQNTQSWWDVTITYTDTLLLEPNGELHYSVQAANWDQAVAYARSQFESEYGPRFRFVLARNF